VPLRSMLESAFRIPAAVENDVRLGAIGENWKGAARGVRDFVFLAIGTGIAAGIFVNGKLMRGMHFTAGEVGYMHVPGTPEQPAKQGEPGSLESIIGGEGYGSSGCVVVTLRAIGRPAILLRPKSSNTPALEMRWQNRTEPVGASISLRGVQHFSGAELCALCPRRGSRHERAFAGCHAPCSGAIQRARPAKTDDEQLGPGRPTSRGDPFGSEPGGIA